MIIGQRCPEEEEERKNERLNIIMRNIGISLHILFKAVDILQRLPCI